MAGERPTVRASWNPWETGVRLSGDAVPSRPSVAFAASVVNVTHLKGHQDL